MFEFELPTRTATQRRKFIAFLGSTVVAWPLFARAQHPTMPVIGFLHAGSPGPFADLAFVLGLKAAGFIDRQNTLIEYRWAGGAYERLPMLAAELMDLRVNVIAAFGTAAARIAKPASVGVTPAVPVVFSIGSDPVAEGFVRSLDRPGGNMTGATSIAGGLAPKRLDLLREFLGRNSAVAILINPENPLSETEGRNAEEASRVAGQRLQVLTATSEREIETVFASLKQRKIAGLVVSVDAFFFRQISRLAQLATQYDVPAIGPLREFAAEGGLMSYGASIFNVNHQAGTYTGKILKGAQPADLPVLGPTTFDFTINLATAKFLGLEPPPKLLALADEVIE
jgi:putative tryptophan/tyrosine transport system substrate-binding protein